MPTSHLLAAEAPANRMVATIINTMARGTSSVRPIMRLRSAGGGGGGGGGGRRRGERSAARIRLILVGELVHPLTALIGLPRSSSRPRPGSRTPLPVWQSTAAHGLSGKYNVRVHNHLA